MTGRHHLRWNAEAAFGDTTAATWRRRSTYTVRDSDPPIDRITIDFVLHGRGIGTEWAQHATRNDQLVLAHANSWYRPETITDWQLLVADLAGLPALARIIEALSADVRAVAVVEVLDDGDIGYLPGQSNVSLIASVGTGNGVTDSALARMVAEQRLPEGRGYCWFGGEAEPGAGYPQAFSRRNGLGTRPIGRHGLLAL